jgi:hypothetical protein
MFGTISLPTCLEGSVVPHEWQQRDALARSWPQFGHELPDSDRLAPHRRGGRPPRLRRAGPTGGFSLRGKEPLASKGLPLAEQVVDGTTEPRGQGLRRAVLLRPAGQPLLGLVAGAEKEARGLGEGPLEGGALPILLPPVPCFLPADS